MFGLSVELFWWCFVVGVAFSVRGFRFVGRFRMLKFGL